ncbi:uncharacterized protein LOC127839655 [Dreissena polymorpha]|uniref:uncharacterized protein LOC127839655 n=1 Tax=Dreissena polymorpha TaxID=45954 RepID=UPI002264AE25|nr:uncharacterized protein LOC127839655 [Dreissena polymorpha]
MKTAMTLGLSLTVALVTVIVVTAMILRRLRHAKQTDKSRATDSLDNGVGIYDEPNPAVGNHIDDENIYRSLEICGSNHDCIEMSTSNCDYEQLTGDKENLYENAKKNNI